MVPSGSTTAFVGVPWVSSMYFVPIIPIETIFAVASEYNFISLSITSTTFALPFSKTIFFMLPTSTPEIFTLDFFGRPAVFSK